MALVHHVDRSIISLPFVLFFRYETSLYFMIVRADLTILSFLIEMAELLIFRSC